MSALRISNISIGRAVGVFIGIAGLVLVMAYLSGLSVHGVNTILPCRANFDYHHGHLVRPSCSNLQLLGKLELEMTVFAVPLLADAFIILLLGRRVAVFLELPAPQRTAIAGFAPPLRQITLCTAAALWILVLVMWAMVVCLQTLAAPIIPIT